MYVDATEARNGQNRRWQNKAISGDHQHIEIKSGEFVDGFVYSVSTYQTSR